MRYRLMATYRGVPYEVGLGPSNSEVVLFAACPPPEELGFEPATGHWRKPVIRAQIDALWESRPVGMFRGEPCMVLDDPGERLHIAYLGTDADRAISLGYWQVDRGVFELLAPREEVTELTDGDLPVRHGTVAGRVAARGRPTAPARRCCHRGNRARGRWPHRQCRSGRRRADRPPPGRGPASGGPAS